MSQSLIHYGNAGLEQSAPARCGENVLFTCLSRTARDITCPVCLGLMALDDPLLLLDEQEARLVRAARKCKGSDDFGLFLQWNGGFVAISRVIRTALPK